MFDIPNWQPKARPGVVCLEGRNVTLEPFDVATHCDGLFHAVGGEENADLWQYIPLGPFADKTTLCHALREANRHQGWQTLVIRKVGDGEVLGMASYMRIREAHGSAEVGCVVFSHALQRTREATEAIALMTEHVFDDLGYRRFEWKCNAANEASKRAAIRFGYSFEGIFRNDMVMKGKNRDTAWYSIIDREWPGIRAAYQFWLRPENFDEHGKQKARLEAYRSAL
ncbi:GNAT family N-acetyltransferase [Kordiimonas sp.]|uniref:GNAT family N-acetyltransferase n=1 Tax=Kordiimonas sp. TaxID=1970157 RepID=UPI003B529583